MFDKNMAYDSALSFVSSNQVPKQVFKNEDFISTDFDTTTNWDWSFRRLRVCRSFDSLQSAVCSRGLQSERSFQAKTSG